MPSYDLCFINEPMGYFERIESFDALNDEVAIGIALHGKSGHSAELWSGGRLVRRFAPVFEGPDVVTPEGDPAAAAA